MSKRMWALCKLPGAERLVANEVASTYTADSILVIEATPATLAAEELYTALNGLLVAYKLGPVVDVQAALTYAAETLAKASGK